MASQFQVRISLTIDFTVSAKSDVINITAVNVPISDLCVS